MTRARVRRIVTAALPVLALPMAVVACVEATAADAFRYNGSWTYAGTQETPSPFTLAGPVSLLGTTAEGFEGTVVLTETAPGGAIRVLSGPVSGLVLQDTILDFTVQLSGIARRHVAVARGDSIAGTWADAAGSLATGRFVLRRGGTR